MSPPTGPLDADRWVVAVTAGLSPVLIWRSAGDPFIMPKATIVGLAAVVLLALGTYRWVSEGRAHLPLAPVTGAAVLFVAALVVATLTSDEPAMSVVGAYKRYGGLAFYGSCAVVLVATVRAFDAAGATRLAYAFLIGGGLAMAYGVLQALGLDPYSFENLYGDAVFSFLGNPNFAGAYAGIAGAFGLWAVLEGRLHPAVRVGGGAVVVASIVTAWKSDSLQGPAVLVVAAGVVALAWLLARDEDRRAALAAKVLLVGGAVAAVAVTTGLARLGPLQALGGSRTVQLRRYYWDAAVAMFVEDPFTGVGLARYGGNYRGFRSQQAALATDLTVSVDAPHSVPLDMFAQGGVLLGVAYLAVVVVTGWALVSGLRRLRGHDLLLLGAFGGAWAAYQVQSLISIDVAPLAAAHWLLAGGIVAIARPPALRVITFPWAPVAPVPNRKRAPTPTASESRQWVALAVSGAVLVVGGWMVTRPIRADIAYSDSRVAAGRGQTGEAFAAALRSTELAPWEATYAFEQGARFLDAGEAPMAIEALREAIRRDGKGIEQTLTAARVEDLLGNPAGALDLYERSLRIEPRSPGLLLEAATYQLANGAQDRAVDLADALTASVPDRPEFWLLLARAHLAGGQEAEARAAADEALDLAPDSVEARELVERLGG